MEFGGFRYWSHHWFCSALWVRVQISAPKKLQTLQTRVFPEFLRSYLSSKLYIASTMLILPQPLDSGPTKKKHSPFLRGGIWQGVNEEIGESSCDGDLCGGVMAEEGKVALVFGIYANTQILGFKNIPPANTHQTRVSERGWKSPTLPPWVYEGYIVMSSYIPIMEPQGMDIWFVRRLEAT